MSYAFDAAEINDLARESAAADRGEAYAAARDESGDLCPPGGHRPRRTRNGGGVCRCGFEVDRDEL